MEWYWYSLTASLVTTVYFSLMKKLFLEGVNRIVLLTIVFTTVSGLLYLYARTIEKVQWVVSTTNLKIIALMAFLAFIQTVCVAKGIEKAPNPGSSQAIVISYIAGMTIFAHFAFGCRMSLKDTAGIILIFAGILLIVTK